MREAALFSLLPMLVAFLTILLAIAGLASPALHTAHDVRLLPVADAKNGSRVTLTGTVTFRPPRGNYFYLQDDTGGVRVEWLANRELRLGERVKVTGVTIAGSFLPEVKASSVVAVETDPPRKNRMPTPVAYTLTMDDAPYLDGQWVEVIAVVQRVWTTDGWLQFDLARGRGSAVAYVPLPLAVQIKKAEQFAGAVVKIRGVCRVNATANRHMAGPPRILVNGLAAFEEIKPPPVGLKVLPPTTARDLAQFRPDPLASRLPVRVTGVVTLNQGSRQFYVHDGTGVVQAFTIEAVRAEPGDRVNVIGYPRLATDPIRLDNAQIQVTGTAPLPQPRTGTPAQAREGKLEGQVVKFTGVVHEARRQGNWMTLTVVAEGLTFTVLILERLPSDGDVTPPAVPGSKVEVVGVATRQPLEGIQRTAFAVMTQTGGLAVLESPGAPPLPPPPSWWTGRRAAYLITGFIGLFLLGGTAVAVLRRQVRRATALVRKQYEEKEKLEGQLKLAAKLEAVGRLAGGIAHDFNNLLTVINGCAQLLGEEVVKDPAHALVLAGEIQRAGGQAAALTRQLLTFSRQRTVTPHPLDLNATIAEAGRVLVRLVGERVTLHVVTEPSIPLVMAEAGLLSQILLNLAVNARDAMPDGGTLTLSTSLAEPGWVRLTTADTGVGMTDEVKSRIFEPFFTTKEVGKGTGLGLSTVYGIVQTLGGKIRFHSELGCGTAFEVDLPAVGVDPTTPTLPGLLTPLHLPLPPASAEVPTTIAGHDETVVASSTQHPAGVPARSESPVVFLVEDDEAVRSLVYHILEHAGFTVLSTTEPEEALIVLADYAGTVDLLITDVMMPKLSGRQLADLVRASRPNTRVLFMSGYTSDEVLLQGVREDQVEFLHKPFAPQELIERVRRILGQQVE